MLVRGLLSILGNVPISVIVCPHFLQVGLSFSDMAYSQTNYAVGLEIRVPPMMPATGPLKSQPQQGRRIRYPRGDDSVERGASVRRFFLLS
jgi:hypothetical protein